MTLTRHHRGFTLTELLVVMVIMLTLMAIALPTVKFNLDESRVREASRQLNASFAKAKAEAALNRRPIGLMFLRDPNDVTRCRQFMLAEIPTPFAGTVTNSACQVRFNGSNSFELTFPNDGAFVDDLVKNQSNPTKNSQFGIQFDYKGPIHVATYQPAGTPKYFISSTNPQLIPSPNPTANPGLSHAFQIYRFPTAINTTPIELARGTYIALDQSGMGATGKEFNVVPNPPPVVVMMSPNGHVASYSVTGTPLSPTGPLHFLVVRERNQAPVISPLSDRSNLWVSVGHLTGAITTSDNNPVSGQERFYAQRHDVRGGR